MVRGTVEETINKLLDAEADQLFPKRPPAPDPNQQSAGAHPA